ncbi:MATE family efflux transporter [Chryseobacterium indologenes]|uniref:Multidrug-efflux transporter n=2 Tax=Chryseobacterium indologenes TaxID=253 RepID=A0A1Z3W0G2_CHRID|nr:MATE family efflux transporter [Chryseobacterium indologenes]ASE61174.1 MATE family efflux transporter [Chryseobacterium indologenes]ATN05259.1 MATE family efflux transporter [Chryseobacterium indologenes]AYY85985.1 MATE family efflux transporter [Chryseobacterium indologenes]AZB16843.1 MATE family efflux transporter [Chryseobacterium indologenes]QIX82889.1 MATE family efflux transporter [Chryseobacterium indologenes]
MRKFLHMLKEGTVFTYGALAGKKVELTSGSINRSIFSLAIPMVMELVMESVFVSVNLLIIARLGDKVLGLVGITDNYINFAYAIAVGLGIAAATLVARRAGEKDTEGMGRTAHYIILLAFFFAVLIGGISCLFASEIVAFLGISTDVVTDGLSFSRLVFLSIGLVILRLSINGLFRGAGDADLAMKSLWLCHISNIVFAVVLVFGVGFIPAFGLMGLAYATILSRLLAVIYQFFILLSGKTSINILMKFHLDIPLLRKILKIAFGGLVQYIIPTSSWLIMVKIISTFGTTALAGYIIAQRIASVATMPAWGIGNAAGVLTGQNLGAGDPDRAEKTVWRAGTINMTYLIAVALFWQIAAEYVVKFFTTETEVARYAVQYIHVVSMAYLLLGFTMVISRALNAAGNIMQVTMLYIIMFYVIQLPLAYLLGVRFQWELTGIFTAIVSSEIVLAVLFLMIFKNGKWKTIKI